MNKWTLGLVLLAGALVLTIVEGAARKWLFAGVPALRYAAYFSKDILFVLAAYLGAQQRRPLGLSIFAVCAVLILASSVAGSIAHSNLVGTVLSIRAYLIIPMCAYLAAPLVRSIRDIERCATVVAVITIGVAVLGAMQYRLPQGHILNRYETGTLESRSEINAGHVRATGTFAFISGMTVMAGLGAWAGVFLSIPLPGRARKLRQLGMAALAASLVCALVSMSRSALLVWGVTAIGGWFLNARANQSVVAVMGVVVAVMAFGVSNPTEQLEQMMGKESLAYGMMNRIRSSDSFADRLEQVLRDTVFGATEYPLGEGLGLGQPGGMYAAYGFRGGLGGKEFEWGRIAFECGIVGLAGVLVIRIVAAAKCWNALKTTTDVSRRAVLATALPFFGIMALGNMAFNHTGNSAAWLVMTFALAAVISEDARVRKAQAPPVTLSDQINRSPVRI